MARNLPMLSFPTQTADLPRQCRAAATITPPGQVELPSLPKETDNKNGTKEILESQNFFYPSQKVFTFGEKDTAYRTDTKIL